MVYCCPLCVYFSSKKQLLFISLQPYIAKVNRANSFNLPSQALLHKSVPLLCSLPQFTKNIPALLRLHWDTEPGPGLTGAQALFPSTS